ncbi:MAG: 3-isopropylmalate dehydratase small subunit [candidate division WOR-3 bacterium]|nr:MAG: 3-isopropylmalate dehydratase small subunit [candidate division WOR-3 bacterium]
METIKGRVYKFGNDINTDVIYPGKYLSITTDREEMAKHCFEAVYPEFLKDGQPGDIIVAGKNFGCGSSREQAATCLIYFGIRAIVAESFARIFYRNAINLGLPVAVAPGVWGMFEHGDVIEIDLENGQVKNERTGVTAECPKLPDFVLGILGDGGLIAHLKKQLRKD